MKHELKKILNGGPGLGGVKVPACLCGWQGTAAKNYNNDQNGMILNQYNNHLRKVKQL